MKKHLSSTNLRIRPRMGESIMSTIKRFKKLQDKEGIIKDIKRHSFYEKPSEIKRRNRRRVERLIEKEKREEEAN